VWSNHDVGPTPDSPAAAGGCTQARASDELINPDERFNFPLTHLAASTTAPKSTPVSTPNRSHKYTTSSVATLPVAPVHVVQSCTPHTPHMHGVVRGMGSLCQRLRSRSRVKVRVRAIGGIVSLCQHALTWQVILACCRQVLPKQDKLSCSPS